MSTDRREDAANADDVSTAVVTAIAEREGVDPTALDPPVYDVVDLDALDALFGGRSNGAGSTVGRVVFTYEGHEVHVTGSDDVRVADSERR